MICFFNAITSCTVDNGCAKTAIIAFTSTAEASLFIAFVMAMLLPSVFATDKINVKVRSVNYNNYGNDVFLSASFTTYYGTSKGMSYVSIPELAIASPKVRVAEFNSKPASVKYKMENPIDNFEFVRISYVSDDNNDRKVRYIPRELLFE